MMTMMKVEDGRSRRNRRAGYQGDNYQMNDDNDDDGDDDGDDEDERAMTTTVTG